MITHLLLLTRWEWFKLRRRWMPWILLAILVVLPQIGVVSSYFIYRGDLNSTAGYTYTLESATGGQQISLELTCADFEDGGIPPQIAELPPQMQANVLNETSNFQTFCLETDSEDLFQSESRRFFAVPASIYNGLSISVGMAIILMIVLTSSSVGSEYSWGTLRTSLTRGTGRWQFLTSKMLLLILAAAAALLISALALLVSSLIFASLIPSSVGGFTDAGNWSTVFVVFGKLVYVLIPYIMLATFFTVVTSSTAVGRVPDHGILRGGRDSRGHPWKCVRLVSPRGRLCPGAQYLGVDGRKWHGSLYIWTTRGQCARDPPLFLCSTGLHTDTRRHSTLALSTQGRCRGKGRLNLTRVQTAH